jgi:hypothetical protein
MLLANPVSSFQSVNTEPAGVPDLMGGFAVVYKSYRDVTGYGNLIAQYINAYGVPHWPQDGIPVCPVAAQQHRAQIARVGHQGFVIVWEDHRRGAERPEIRAQLLNPQGEAQWPAEGLLVAAGPDYPQTRPRILPDQSDGVLVLWEQPNYFTQQAGGQYRALYGQRLAADGSRLWGESGRAILEPDYDWRSLQLELAPGQGAVLVWAAQRNARWQLYAQRLDGDGNRAWATGGLPLASDPAINQQNPALLGDGFGGFVCAYERASLLTRGLDVYALRLNRSGEVVYDLPLGDSPEDQRNPRLCRKGSQAVAYWEDERSGERNIVAQSFDFGTGALRWPADGVSICALPGEQSQVQLMASPITGEQLAVWLDRRDADATLLFAQVTSLEGKPLLQADGIPVARGVVETNGFVSVPDERGGAWVVWLRKDGMYSYPHFQHIRPDDGLRYDLGGVPLFSIAENQGTQLAALTSTQAPDGSLYLAWEDYRNGPRNPDIYVQRLSDQGKPLWRQHGLPACAAPGAQRMPTLAANSRGVFVGWLDQRRHQQDADTLDVDLYVQFLSPEGQILWVLNGLPICVAPRSQNDLRLVPLGDTALRIYWADARFFNSQGFDIYLQEFDLQGNHRWPIDGQPIVQGTANQFAPQPALMGQQPVLLWQDNRTGFFNHYFQPLLPDGRPDPAQPERNLTPYPAHMRFLSTLTGRDRSLIICWHDEQFQFNGAKVRLQSLGPGGSLQWPSRGQDLPGVTGQQLGAQLAPALSTNGVLVAWLSETSPKSQRYHYRVQALSAGGVAQWPQPGAQAATGLAEDADRHLLTTPDAVWLACVLPDHTGARSLRATALRHNDGAQRALWNLDRGFNAVNETELLPLAGGRVGLLWIEQSSFDGQCRLYLQPLSLD